MHVVEAFVDLGELAVVGDVLVDLDLALEVVCTPISIPNSVNTWAIRTLNEARKLGATLDTTERGSTPGAPSYQLESAPRMSENGCYRSTIRYLRASRDFLASRSNTNDGADTPALVASLKRSPHDMDLE